MSEVCELSIVNCSKRIIIYCPDGEDVDDVNHALTKAIVIRPHELYHVIGKEGDYIPIYNSKMEQIDLITLKYPSAPHVYIVTDDGGTQYLIPRPHQ